MIETERYEHFLISFGEQQFLNLAIMAHFYRRLRVGSVCKGATRVAFPPPKVGVGVSRTRLTVLLR